MNTPSIMLATLCLNEMEHLPYLYEQHKDWPGLKSWVFVEAADKVYAQANPDLVNKQGLSIDGTTEFLQWAAREDPRITYVPYGFTTNENPAQGKIAARQRYLDISNTVRPDYFIMLDADEFWCKDHQVALNDYVAGSSPRYTGFQVKYRDIWRPDSIKHQPLFQYEVVGGYWDVKHCHCWRWYPNLQHHTHMHITGPSGSLNKIMMPLYMNPSAPQCIHLGFASLAHLRKAKNYYYIARGEGHSDGRLMYVECRRSFETWRPGNELPHGARVIPYTGKIPEVYQCLQTN